MQDTFQIRNKSSLDTRDTKMPVELVKAIYDLKIQSMLDIGCGSGWLCDYLPQGTRYLGFDPDQKCVDNAKKLHPEGEFLRLTIQEFLKRSSEEKFDAAFLKCIFCTVNPNPTEDVVKILEKAVEKYVFVYDTEREAGYWTKPFMHAGFQLVFNHIRQTSHVQIWRI